ncbi:Rhomboid protease glpG [Enterobacter cloacae]|uniref:Rhomboid protease glpG n=1 Tax=Enterobacter cloacae TaxID=550 RepID=A0A377LS38_ENTCL|nr:Rhomboid protease glpG [Enterobacter cloacae]
MLMITSFTNPRVAQAFVDYMATQGIILTVQQHTKTDVWLADESQADRVNAELARFLENPATLAIWRELAVGADGGADCTIGASPSLPPFAERAGPFTLLLDGGLHYRLHHYERGGATRA